MSENSLIIPESLQISAKKIDSAIALASQQTNGFLRAFNQAQAIEVIRECFTAEVLKPIKSLQNTKIGFLTDSETGYKDETVKTCVIDALLNGFQVTGNEFNIIAGKMYPTKEGYGGVLKRMPGLKYKWTVHLPKIISENSSTVDVDFEWTLNGNKRTETVTFPVRVNKGMLTDAVIGKAERKAGKWLFITITERDLGDADATDKDVIIVDDSKKDTTTRTSSQDIKPTERNANVTEAEVIQEAEVVDERPFVDNAEQLRADNYFRYAKSSEDLEARLKQVQSKATGRIKMNVYNEVKQSYLKS